MRDTFIARLYEHAKTDKDIVLVTGDLGFGVLTEFAEKLPEQFINAGVAEQNMTGLATGLALAGKTALTYSIANFPILRCLEQIRNDAAYHDANVKVVSIGGGFSYGALGMSHHATEDIAIMRALPQVTCFVPGCLWETEEITTAMLNHDGTCYLRLDKSNAGRTNDPDETFEIGKARWLREGDQITLVTTGGILGEVLAAADELESAGVSCGVVSVPTIKPFDKAMVDRAISDAPLVMTVEEHVLNGGLGSAFAEHCMDTGKFPRGFKRLGITGGYCATVGSQSFLREQYGLHADGIVQSAKQMTTSLL